MRRLYALVIDEQSFPGNCVGTLLAGETGGEVTVGACPSAIPDTSQRLTAPTRSIQVLGHILRPPAAAIA